MNWQPSEEEKKYLRLVLGMTTDCIMGEGTDSAKTYADNLIGIAKGIENDYAQDQTDWQSQHEAIEKAAGELPDFPEKPREGQR